MNQHVADRLRFLRAFVANPRQVGAVLPTSRYAVRDMLDLGDVPGAGLVVELGAGTGSQTAEVLARMKPDARLVALEIDPNLAKVLKERFDDPRLQVVCDSAENLHDHLGGQKVDVLVCALPFTSLEPGLRRRILEELPRVLAPHGAARGGQDGTDLPRVGDEGAQEAQPICHVLIHASLPDLTERGRRLDPGRNDVMAGSPFANRGPPGWPQPRSAGSDFAGSALADAGRSGASLRNRYQ